MGDFLVIGGGIAGIAAGARLSALGKVTVLEGESQLGYHASGRSAAMFEQTYGLPSTIALNHASAAYHHHANGGVLSPRGLMLVGGPGDDAAFANDMVSMAMQRISFAEARAIVPVLNPDTVTMVGLHEEAWDLDTDRLIQNFARDIRSNGGRVETGRQVSAITRTATGWHVTAGNAVYEAVMLVNAAGAWADPVAEMAGIAPLGFQPYRRSIARIPAPGGHDVNRWPMMFGPGETWYAKPDAGLLLVSPADEHPMDPHDAWADDMVLAEGLARYEEKVTEPVTRVVSNWAGLRTFSPDRNLVIGPAPRDPAFLWMAGQGGYGFQTAPAASQLLADLVAGTTPELDPATIAALSPERYG